uniref:Uncharacterized protein n=1 Tax=Haemonchus contortus TaxID=6289 RepID=A0A7I4Z3X1_HAECO
MNIKTKNETGEKTIGSNKIERQSTENIASYRLAERWMSTIIAVTFAACRKGECSNRGEVPLPWKVRWKSCQRLSSLCIIHKFGVAVCTCACMYVCMPRNPVLAEKRLWRAG